MTFSPMKSAAVSDQGAGPPQPAPESVASHASYGADPAQEETGQEDAQDVAWPHQSYLELGSLPTAAPCARLHTMLVLWEWDLGALAHTAAVVVSELVTNAVQASRGIAESQFSGTRAPGTPPVRMWLSADECRLVIQVWDGSDQPPEPQPVEPEADSGRGLLLVGSLSAEWGCYEPENSSGKVVWAVIAG
jgi:anti-sigma regulatory factor (Ser/Thr protein kinase)